MDKPLKTQSDYMPQLDALRTLAVAVVAIYHWEPRWAFNLPFGQAGVQLFFVLSGYLITGILIRAKDDYPEATTGFRLRTFYARRFLRIFPLYYAVVFLGCLINLPPFRETAIWNLTYTTNFHLFFRQEYHLWISHFWSLAVEEQFYFVWPFLMLLSPVRYRKGLIVAIIAVAVAYRLGVALVLPDLKLAGVMLIPNMDALGGGALLAVMGAHSKSAVRLMRWLLVVGICGTIVLYGYAYTNDALKTALEVQLRHICMIAMFCWLIRAAAVGFQGPVKTILENRVLVSLGTVSYGLYILHNLAPPVLTNISNSLGIETMSSGIPRLLCLTAMTVGGAYFSWYLYEKPINSLKRNFPYRPRPAKAAARAQVQES